MNVQFVATLIILGIVSIVFGQIIHKNNHGKDVDNRKEDNQDSVTMEMEEVFFERAKEGSKPYLFLSVGNQLDLMFIKSLFQSEQIPFFIEYENMGNLKPGVRIDTYNDMRVYIVEEDYDDAVQVIEGYEEGKGTTGTEDIKGKVRNMAEFLIGGWAIPTKEGRERIEIHRKG